MYANIGREIDEKGMEHIDVSINVGKGAVETKHFNDPLFLKNFCWRAYVQKDFDRLKTYHKRSKKTKGIGVVLYFNNDLSDNDKEDLYNWILQNLALMTTGHMDHKLYTDRILLKQKVTQSNRNSNLWDAFLKFGTDNKEPIAGTYKFLTNFQEAYMIVDQQNKEYEYWNPLEDCCDFYPAMDYSDTDATENDLKHLLTVDIYEALGVRNYFKRFFSKKEMTEEEQKTFWISFLQYTIAWCSDHADGNPANLTEEEFLSLFAPDAVDTFNKNIRDAASKMNGFTSLRNLRQFIIWEEVKYQKERREQKVVEKKTEKAEPIIAPSKEVEDIPF